MNVRAVIVLPSYNESQNIVQLVDQLLIDVPACTVCVVDDSSPDGTTAIVADAIAANGAWQGRVHLITRAKKDGRGGAVRDGLTWALAQEPGFDVFAEMDCDFSHEPSAVPRGVSLVTAGHDVVIGARYPNGTIIGWPRRRKVFSAMANELARLLIDRSVDDYTNGFRFYSRPAAAVLVERPQRHRGYIYLSESLSYLLRSGMSVSSYPIIFRNRERGVSNTGVREVGRALIGIVSIAWDHHLHRL